MCSPLDDSCQLSSLIFFLLQDYFESYLSIASTVPSVLCLILNYFLVNRLKTSKHADTHTHTIYPIQSTLADLIVLCLASVNKVSVDFGQI